MDAIYSSVMIGGIFVTFFGASGLFKHLRQFFTANVIAVVLLLIAFTIAPTILKLIIDSRSTGSPILKLTFAFVMVFVMLVGYRLLIGIWQSTLIIWAVIAGSLLYLFLFTDNGSREFSLDVNIPWFRSFFRQINIALSVNDLGSIQAVNEMLQTSDMDGRIARGIFTTGLANTASGLLGVIGPVNYTISSGVILANRCASRFTLGVLDTDLTFYCL